MPTVAQMIAQVGRSDTIINLRAILTALNAGASSPAALDLQLTADYTNSTAVASNVVSGSITTTGQPLLILAAGLFSLVAGESKAVIQNLTEDFPAAFVSLYLDGVAVDHGNCDLQTYPTLALGTWFVTNAGGDVAMLKLVTGLAPGVHTLAVKAGLYGVPASGALLASLAASAPSVYGFNLRAFEI